MESDHILPTQESYEYTRNLNSPFLSQDLVSRHHFLDNSAGTSNGAVDYQLCDTETCLVCRFPDQAERPLEMDLELNDSPDIAPNELHSESTGLSGVPPPLVPSNFWSSMREHGYVAPGFLDPVDFPPLPSPVREA